MRLFLRLCYFTTYLITLFSARFRASQTSRGRLFLDMAIFYLACTFIIPSLLTFSAAQPTDVPLSSGQQEWLVCIQFSVDDVGL